MLALNENLQCWDWDGGLARIGSKEILPRIGCRLRLGIVLARRYRSCGLVRRPERCRHCRVSHRKKDRLRPLILKYMQKVPGGLMIMPVVIAASVNTIWPESSSGWRSHYGLVLHRRYGYHRHRALRFNGSLEEMNCTDKAKCIPVQYPLTDKNTPFMSFSLLRNTTSISNQLRRKIAIYQQE